MKDTKNIASEIKLSSRLSSNFDPALSHDGNPEICSSFREHSTINTQISINLIQIYLYLMNQKSECYNWVVLNNGIGININLQFAF